MPIVVANSIGVTWLIAMRRWQREHVILVRASSSQTAGRQIEIGGFFLSGIASSLAVDDPAMPC